MNEISGKIENVHSSIFQSGKQPDPNTLVDEYFLYCGEVDGDQVIDMVIQERSSRLGGRFPLSRHQSGDRPFRDLNPQFLQFPVIEPWLFL